MSAPARRALLAAATVVMLLALGPFATPLVDGNADPAPVDHRNDVPVVQRTRSTSDSTSVAGSMRTVPLVVLVVAIGFTLAVIGRRPVAAVLDPEGSPRWSSPPHRGPPLLLAG
jgi:hypothetical protein